MNQIEIKYQYLEIQINPKGETWWDWSEWWRLEIWLNGVKVADKYRYDDNAEDFKDGFLLAAKKLLTFSSLKIEHVREA